MEITISNKQYEKLVKLIYLGMWIVESHDSKDNNDFIEIEQLIYSQIKNIPGSQMIQYDEVTKKYYPSIDFDKDDIIADHLDNYDENCFWDELIDRLTKRDMLKKFGLENIHNMSHKEVFENEKEIIAHYESAFEESGVLKLFMKSESENQK
ncbi:MAG: hypothetical protein OEV66_11805 [Spirochaetia bacterium]|nr:hypothetical protein [Spirochaetia bacterium]